MSDFLPAPVTYQVHRDLDPTGELGVGHIADAVEFWNGKVVLCWRTPITPISVYSSLGDAILIHNRDGATTFTPYPTPEGGAA